MTTEDQQQFLQEPFSPPQAGAYSMITVNINGVQKTMLVPSLSTSVVRTPVPPTVPKTVTVRTSSCITSSTVTGTSLRPTFARSLVNVSMLNAQLMRPGLVLVPSPQPRNIVRVVTTIQRPTRNATRIAISRNHFISPRSLSAFINRNRFSTNQKIIVMPSYSGVRALVPPPLRGPLSQSGPRPTMLFGPPQTPPRLRTVLQLGEAEPYTAKFSIRRIVQQTNFVTQVRPQVVPSLYEGDSSAMLQCFVPNEANALVHNNIIEIAPDTDSDQIKSEILNESQDTKCMLNAIENSNVTAETQKTEMVSDQSVDLPHFTITNTRSVQPSNNREHMSKTTPCVKTPMSSWDANLLDVLGIYPEKSLERTDGSQSSSPIGFTLNDTRATSETDTATSDIEDIFDHLEKFDNLVVRENATNAVVSGPKRRKRRHLSAYSVLKRKKRQVEYHRGKSLIVKADIEAVDMQQVFIAKRTGGRPMLGRSVTVDSKLANGCYTYVERVLLKCDSINIKRNVKKIFCCNNGVVNTAFRRQWKSFGIGVKNNANKNLLPVSKKLSKRRRSFAVAHCTDSTLRISNALSLRDCTISHEKLDKLDIKDESIECGYDEKKGWPQLNGISDVGKTNASSTSPMKTVYVQSRTRSNNPVPMQMSASQLPPDLPDGTKFMLIKTTDGTYIMPMEMESKTVTSKTRNNVNHKSRRMSSRHIPGTLRRQASPHDLSLSTPPESVRRLPNSVETNRLSLDSPASGISEIFSSKVMENQVSAEHEIVDVESLDSDESLSVFDSTSNTNLKLDDDSCKPSHRDRINRLKEAMKREEEQLDALRKQRL